jgi:uncharacterized DUF497 family protein
MYIILVMKYFDWDKEKNEWLIENRGICFEMCVTAFHNKGLLATVPNKHPYTHQKKFMIVLNNYVYVVPYVEDDEKIFLKTIYPSRKAKKKYLSK